MPTDAVAYYHDLLSSGTALAADSQAVLEKSQQLRGLFFGTRPVCTVLRPRFLSPAQYRLLHDAVKALLPAFCASGLTLQEFASILAAANTRCAVAACAAGARMARLGRMGLELDVEAFAQGDMTGQIRILRQIASYSGDELAHLFARSVWYYLARQNTGPYACDTVSARMMVDVTRDLVSSVLSGNPTAAEETCRELHRQLGELAVKSITSQHRPGVGALDPP